MPNLENVVLIILLVGIVFQWGWIAGQAFVLHDWKRRAINAETEVKHMTEIYGPRKH